MTHEIITSIALAVCAEFGRTRTISQVTRALTSLLTMVSRLAMDL